MKNRPGPESLYSHLVLRSTFFFFFSIATRNEAIGKELKGRGVGAGVEEWAQKKKDKMQKKSDLQVIFRDRKKRQGTLGKWGKGIW